MDNRIISERAEAEHLALEKYREDRERTVGFWRAMIHDIPRVGRYMLTLRADKIPRIEVTPFKGDDGPNPVITWAIVEW